MKRFFDVTMAALVALALVAAALGGLALMGGGAEPVTAQNQTACYGTQGGALNVAASGCEYEFQAGSVIDTQGNARQLVQPASLVITDGQVISNVYGLQRVTMTVDATATLTTTGYITGDVLSFYNVTTPTLTIADADPVKASGDIALGQYDVAALWFDGSYWIQTGEGNN